MKAKTLFKYNHIGCDGFHVKFIYADNHNGLLKFRSKHIIFGY